MRSRGRKEELTSDLTPLIDVVFLLLIFFVVTSVFKKDQYALGLSLPESKESGKSTLEKKEKLVIELSSDKLAFNNKSVSFEDLNASLRPVEKKEMIELRVAKDVMYQRLIKVLDILKENNLSNISLITEKKED